LSVALVFVALALMELLRQRWSVTRYAAFVVIIIASYLTHLAATVFIGAAVGISAAWRVAFHRRAAFREARITAEILLILPMVVMLAWHQLVAVHYRQPTDLYNQFSIWGTPRRKISKLTWDFLRYNTNQELAALVLLVALLGFALRERLFRDGLSRKGPQVLEPWAYAAMFLVMYVALPFAQAEASYIDVRTLALVPVFVILGLLNLPRRATSTGSVVYYLAIALVAVNLAILTFHFRKNSIWIAHYRAVVAKIPEHSRVLPIYTGVRVHDLLTYLHAGSFAVIDRHALIPYQFSGNVGSPMKYFRYAQLPYAPSEFWYHEGKDASVDWRRVSDTYRYALIMKPFSPERIPLKGHIVAENDAVELLAIDSAKR
ncbi:MAG TPA: hypothetical protein VGE93_05050, partial [Bryobacteraceae bacterium]